MGLNDIADRIIHMELLPTPDYKYYCCIKIRNSLRSQSFESVESTPEAAIQTVVKAAQEAADRSVGS